MDLLQITLLSLVQGLTEFLPISSSAHLIVVPLVFGYELQTLAFDLATHVGTLVAVMLYFRRQLGAITAALFDSLKTRRIRSPDASLGLLVGLSLVPLLILGIPLKYVLEWLRQETVTVALVIATTSLLFALLLWFADAKGTKLRDQAAITWRMALIIGLFQAVAVIPGTSRSGITITAGLLLGLSREASARFSFLLSIPVIILAAVLELHTLLQDPPAADWFALGLGALLSFIVAYLTIHVFLRIIERVGMLPFVLYRLLLGGLILGLLLVGW